MDTKSIFIAEDAVALLRQQLRSQGKVYLKSIKIALPAGSNADEVSEYINNNHPELKAHSKPEESGLPIIAIGFR